MTFTCLLLSNLYGQDLQKHKWENRILIVKTTTATLEVYKSQLNEFVHSYEDLRERKLVLYQIVDDKYKFIDFQKKEDDSLWEKTNNSDEQFFDEADSFKIILIGLDGGVKLEKRAILKREELFELIDSMPMRRAELRKQRTN